MEGEPEADAGRNRGNLRGRFLLLWAALLLAKLLLAWRLPMFVDEAFYAWESRRLAWAYSDLPGLSAWLAHAGLGLGGNHALALRLPFLLLASALPWLLVRITRRWFGVGGIGVQPSELAKLVAIFFIAALLERRMHRIDEVTYSVLPIAIVVLGLVALILPEPDFGTSMAILMIAAVMIFAAGLNWRYLVGVALVALPAIYLVVMGSAYRRRRTLAFLNPWDDPLGDGFQIIQSLIAVGTGGVTGKGLMNGVQKLFYLPEPHTDFIYSVISEELGLVGATAVLACFCVITWRGLRVALRAPDSFGAFLALGLTTMVAVQALVNISVVLGMMPTKGIPLPFVSAGGSSLLINLVGMGILLNVSQHATSSEA